MWSSGKWRLASSSSDLGECPGLGGTETNAKKYLFTGVENGWVGSALGQQDWYEEEAGGRNRAGVRVWPAHNTRVHLVWVS